MKYSELPKENLRDDDTCVACESEGMCKTYARELANDVALETGITRRAALNTVMRLWNDNKISNFQPGVCEVADAME